MKTQLYNTAHPLAESGKPIFIPFGEWNYDGQHRQRLDRAHGERIANELNARVAKGEPGIPVYQGHPDVPALAAKYPDKGALGWVVRAELVNESPDGRAVPGLALTVEWDRDPGRGFRWFSPYWLANSRDGGTYIVDEIASIGLVNNPNIPEFRLANSVDANGREHVDAGVPEGGQFAPKAGEWDAKGRKLFAETVVKYAKWKKLDHRNRRDLTMIANDLLKNGREKYSLSSRYLRKSKSEAKRGDEMHSFYGPQTFSDEKRDLWTSMKELHRYAILHGLTYNPKSHQYE